MESKVRAGPEWSLWTLGQAFCFFFFPSLSLFWLNSQRPWACLGWAFGGLRVCMTAPLLRPGCQLPRLGFSSPALLKPRMHPYKIRVRCKALGLWQGRAFLWLLHGPPQLPQQGLAKAARGRLLANTTGTQRPKARSTRPWIIVCSSFHLVIAFRAHL